MFLAEGREHLQELNLAVVRIEETPDDQETVDEIFRIAHSMKGMSATMGFAGMAALTHEMEDVFELLKQRRGGLSREAIDCLLECLDALSAAVDSIDETGAEAIQPEPLIVRLKGLIRDADEAPEEAPADESRGAEMPDKLSELAGGRRVVQISATLRADTQMPSVRAYMLLSAIAGLGETLACIPAPDDVDAFSGSDIDAWIVSERTDSELAEVAGAVPDVDDVQVFEAIPDAAVEHGDEDVEAGTPATATPQAV
jgi:two-component system chemotaxis sensor kinase CheA